MEDFDVVVNEADGAHNEDGEEEELDVDVVGSCEEEHSDEAGADDHESAHRGCFAFAFFFGQSELSSFVLDLPFLE